MKFTKEHEGQTIYALPTGNNARYHKDKVFTFEVVKVKRKYVEMSEGNSSYTDNYCPKSGATQSEINNGYGLNAGYKFFESLEDITKYHERCDKEAAIQKFFSGFGNPLSELDDRDIDVLYGILYKSYE